MWKSEWVRALSVTHTHTHTHTHSHLNTSLSSVSVLRNSVTPLMSLEFINKASPYLADRTEEKRGERVRNRGKDGREEEGRENERKSVTSGSNNLYYSVTCTLDNKLL